MHESGVERFSTCVSLWFDLIDGNLLCNAVRAKVPPLPDLTGTQITPYLILDSSLPNPNDCYIV
jgi:hypothetical protein